MPKPIELSQIFTQVRVADGIVRQQSATETEIVKRLLRFRSKQKLETMKGVVAVESASRVVVLGRPGSGKSTFIKYLMLQAAKKSIIDRLPIIIFLNECGDREPYLQSAILKVFRSIGLDYSQEFLYCMMQEVGIYLFLDGLDEVPSSKKQAIVLEIKQFMSLATKSKILLTCRTAAYEYWFGDCHHYELQKFELKAMIYFIMRWFSYEKKRAKELIKRVISNQRLFDLCGSPLMLTIICIAFSDGLDVSNNRAEVYKEAIDVLLRKWDVSRGIFRDNLYRDLSVKRREDLLADLAVRTFVNGVIAIPDQLARISHRVGLATL